MQIMCDQLVIGESVCCRAEDGDNAKVFIITVNLNLVYVK